MTALSGADSDLVDRESILPGLGCVLDPGRLLEALGPDAIPAPPDDIRLDYVRYRPQRDCIGRYRISIDGTAHLAYAKAFAEGALHKLDKAVHRPGPEGPRGAGRQAVSGKGLLFCWFPNDRKLRSIGRLGETTARERLLQRIFSGNDTWRDAGITVLNYKPEKRLVARLAGTDDQTAVVKFYTQAEYDRTTHLRRDRSPAAALPVPRYIGGSRKHRVHAFRWLPGKSLREFSLDPGGDPTLHRRAGHLLAELHARLSLTRPRVRSGSPADVAASAAEHLTSLIPELGPAAQDCARLLGRLADGAARDECALHADFYDKQVIVGPSGLALIDLDQARRGAPGEDLGCFIAHLEYLALSTPHMTADRVGVLSRSLLDGYVEAGGRYNERQLDGWTALSLFCLAHQPFRDRLPDWPDCARAVVARTQALLTAAGPTG